MTHRYHPDARKELDDATDYYDRIDLELGDAFLEEIDDSISRILRFPRAWTKLRDEVRRCLIHRFPYSLVYEVGRWTCLHSGRYAFEPKAELLG